MFKKFLFSLTLIVSLFMSKSSFALHPLITEGTGTQGKGKLELEIGTEYAKDAEAETIQKTHSQTTTLTYGLYESVDLILGIPYQNITTENSESKADEEGISDILMEMKWKFYDKGKLSLALKPSISLPLGNEKHGLGNGKATTGLYFVITQEINPFVLHFNLMYKRNENKINQRKNLWHISLASEFDIVERLKLVTNIGIDRNPNQVSNVDPAFILGGLVYSLSEDLDVDIGYKHELNKPAADYSLLGGITFRF